MPHPDLGTYQTCSICGRSGWSNRHRCPPKWEAISADEYHEALAYPDDPTVAMDWTLIYAIKAQEAAELYLPKAIGWYGEHIDDLVVAVRPAFSDDPPQFFRVTCEMVPTFDAQPITEEEAMRPYAPVGEC
jgi:hypothetical protein